MTWIILLILVGLLLFIIEVFFVPGTTVIGVLGFILAATGVYLAYRQFGSTTGHITLSVSFVLILVLLYFAAKSGIWTKFANNDQIHGKANVIETDSINVGDFGRAISTIKPMGKARINGKNYEVRSLGEFINTGEKIQITKISGNQITVKLIQTTIEQDINTEENS